MRRTFLALRPLLRTAETHKIICLAVLSSARVVPAMLINSIGAWQVIAHGTRYRNFFYLGSAQLNQPPRQRPAPLRVPAAQNQQLATRHALAARTRTHATVRLGRAAEMSGRRRERKRERERERERARERETHTHTQSLISVQSPVPFKRRESHKRGGINTRLYYGEKDAEGKSREERGNGGGF